MKLVDAKHTVIINKGAQRFYFIYLVFVVVVWFGGSCFAWFTFAFLLFFLPTNNCPLKQLGLGKISRVLSLA